MKTIFTTLLLIASTCLHAGAQPLEETYTFVYIVTGPAIEIDQETQQKAFQGHFSNMSRMADEGDLLIAGPYWKPKSFDDLRGMWIFATDDIDEALKHAATDPPGQLGIFEFEALQIKTNDAVLELPRLEKEDEERRLSDPDVDDAWVGRGYFWATAPVDGTDRPQLNDSISLYSTLIGREGTRVVDDHWLLLLNATTAEEAEQVLTESGCDASQWTLDEWYGSTMPARLPEFRGVED
ncbi:MAG: hypothetical protein JJ974_08210 [Phycisphaerales bacterium]|nr:hypothetical protein [Phycisphaerales bacterium]